jgi:hypothetical protein
MQSGLTISVSHLHAQIRDEVIMLSAMCKRFLISCARKMSPSRTVLTFLIVAVGSVMPRLATAQSGTLVPGTPTSVSITTPGQNAVLTFSGTAGQQVNVWLLSSTIPGSCYSLTLSVLKPDGSTLKSAQMCGQGNFGFSFLTLPVTGTYSVVIAPTNSGTGTATVMLSTELMAGSLTAGTATPVTISTAGQNAILTFSGTAGQQANVWLLGSTIPGGCYSLNLSVQKPDGSTLKSAQMCGQGNFGFSFLNLPTTGTYSVIIAPQNAATGSVNVMLSAELMAGNLTAGTATPITISTQGQNAISTFTGTAGQQVNVWLLGSTIPGGCYSLNLSVQKPEGSTLKSGQMCGQGNYGFSFLNLPTTGT